MNPSSFKEVILFGKGRGGQHKFVFCNWKRWTFVWHCVFSEHVVCLLWFLGILLTAGWIQHTLPYAIWKPVSFNQHEHNLFPVYVAYSHGAWGLRNKPYAGFALSYSFANKMKMTLLYRNNTHWGFRRFMLSIAVFLLFFLMVWGQYKPVGVTLCELICYCLTVAGKLPTVLTHLYVLNWLCVDHLPEKIFYQGKSILMSGISSTESQRPVCGCRW